MFKGGLVISVSLLWYQCCYTISMVRSIWYKLIFLFSSQIVILIESSRTVFRTSKLVSKYDIFKNYDIYLLYTANIVYCLGKTVSM